MSGSRPVSQRFRPKRHTSVPRGGKTGSFGPWVSFRMKSSAETHSAWRRRRSNRTASSFVIRSRFAMTARNAVPVHSTGTRRCAWSARVSAAVACLLPSEMAARSACGRANSAGHGRRHHPDPLKNELASDATVFKIRRLRATLSTHGCVWYIRF